MKFISRFSYLPNYLLVLVFLIGGNLQAQETMEKEKDLRPVKNTFESIWIIDNQTVMVPIAGTFEMDFQHRFGRINGRKYQDLYGIFAPSNIRIGMNYTPVERLQLGFGFMKERMIWDFNAKYALLRQARSGGSPLSVTYFVNAAMDTRNMDKTPYAESSDRWSFFHQVMVGRKVTDAFSLQAAGNVTHFNFYESIANPEVVANNTINRMQFAASVSAKYSLTSVMGLIANADFPLSSHDAWEAQPNISFGIELISSSHAFQLFLGNYYSIVPQYNQVYNLNDFGSGDLLIGFNITRLWNW